MYFEFSDKVKELQYQVTKFMEQYVYPNEKVYEQQLNEGTSRWEVPPIIEEMKIKAKEKGLWNLFLPESEYGAGLTNLEFAPLCEIMGRSPFIGPEAFNCSAPDTGNMEVLVRYGTEQQKKEWLIPLLEGKIRSAFAMTEPLVASSDARNIQSSIKRDGDHYVINGRKWWTSGAPDPRCKILIFMGKSNPDAPTYEQQSMILVPIDTPGVKVLRNLNVYGYDDAPHGHGEVLFENVRVPASNMILGEGKGFAIAQGRLGPGRIHHCMRLIGLAERALESMIERAQNRVTFGSAISDKGVIRQWIADSRIELDQARLLTLKAAYMMDKFGNKEAKKEIAMIKIVAPEVATKIIDRAIQVHGGGGVSQDFPLARHWAYARIVRLADGPNEVHREAVAKQELKQFNQKETKYTLNH
ncbi:acyl-CoA dehydrogenase family protein [Peribacillus asahii]|uniref:acyl-CoA dehydrogenase family protein n=1 Tax=Peribacillus asahii TaxID=228899 RepID=UPI00207A2C8E|nr:acyl-CoA dehydrogenase family protein [Peribacillus asahii]USK68719.1 acyl-CoA dehydrogenase family protein [Peribacillus asahii]